MLFNAAVLGGGGGLALGILPYVVKIKDRQSIKKQDVIDSLQLTGLGLIGGLTATGLIESMRNPIV